MNLISTSFLNPSALAFCREAAGLQDPLVLKYAKPGAPAEGETRRQFSFPFLLIGRDPGSDLALDHPAISRRHAFVPVIGGRPFVIDLQSRTHITWEGEAEARPHGWLDRSQGISLGPYTILWEPPPGYGPSDEVGLDPLAPAGADSDNSNGLSRASLELPIRTAAGPSHWPFESRLALMGRSDACQLVLAHESVSRYHAALLRTPLGLWVVDLGARQGVLVNETRVRWAWLAEGDALKIGQFDLRVRYESLAGRISRADVPLSAGAAANLPALMKPSGRQLSPSGGTSLSATSTLPARSFTRSRSLARSTRAPSPDSSAIVPSLPPLGYETELQWPSQQMAVWQQQMQFMESFHRDMILMVQMFMAMHREHVTSVRGELDRVEQLTQELSRLQHRLTDVETGRQPASARTAPPEAASTDAAQSTSASRRRADPQAGRSEPGSRSAPVGPSAGSGPAPGSVSRPADRNGRRPGDRPSRAQQQQPQAFPDAELHSQLSRRIVELQRERQGYWQKIISSISK